jgi:hypothetical protein
MWLPVVLVVAATLPGRIPLATEPTPVSAAPVTLTPVIDAAPVTTPVTTPLTTPVVGAEAVPTNTAPALHSTALSLEVGIDVPAAQRLPMASTRLELDWRLALPASAFAGVGLRSGYSFVSGEVAVADPVLGVDNHALLMAHRIPMRMVGRLGLNGDGIDVGILASGGADVALIQAQSFGRVGSQTAVMPAGSVGGFLDIALGDAFSLGVMGEWDSAVADLAALTPGLSGDLSALRLALVVNFLFG